MAFHRRLLDESAPDKPYAVQFCGPYCHATVNPQVICPLTCIVLCPDNCKIHFLQIPPPPPPSPVEILDGAPEKQYRVSLLLTISLAFLATAFFFSTCYAVYRLCSNRHSSRRSWWRRRQAEEDNDFLDEEHGPVVDHPTWYIRTVGLQPLVISAITVVRYKRGDGLIEDTDCSVCLHEFEEDETLRLLPKCNHAFHIPCIDTWLRSHTNCPICRAEIVNNTEPLELIVHSPENRVGGVSGSRGEVRREPENESSELRFGVEDHGESRAHQVGLKMDENLGEEDKSDGVKPMRRSVSVESLSSVANAFPGQWVEEKRHTSGVIAPKVGANQSLLRLVGSPSTERCRQSGTSSIKRSLSCGAKVFPSRHSSKSPNSATSQ